MPIVESREEYERFTAAMNKKRGVSPQPKASKPELRYLYIRYKKNGGFRASRLTVRDKGLRTHHCEVVGDYKMSQVLKARNRHGLILELDKHEHLEVLIQQALEYLKADPDSEWEWYWDKDVEDL